MRHASRSSYPHTLVGNSLVGHNRRGLPTVGGRRAFGLPTGKDSIFIHVDLTMI